MKTIRPIISGNFPFLEIYLTRNLGETYVFCAILLYWQIRREKSKFILLWNVFFFFVFLQYVLIVFVNLGHLDHYRQKFTLSCIPTSPTISLIDFEVFSNTQIPSAY